MNALSDAIGWLLAVFYSVVPNLGVCIILLTCTVMLVLFPLTAKQARSMIAMQRVQPEIKKIQQKYKDDRQKQNEEVMRFYQENKINPLSGCFPLLMQLPVFWALYRMLENTQDHVPTTGRLGSLFHDICGNVANAAACDHPKGLQFLSMDLSVAPAKAGSVTDGFLGTLPYFILVGLVILTGWYQARQTMARQAKTGTTPMNTQAQIIGRVMPVVFGVISLNFATGLVVYFIASNLWRIGQQQLVLNKLYDQPAPVAKFTEKSDTDERESASKPAGGTKSGGGKGGSGGTSSGGGGGKGAGRAKPGAGAPAARARPNPNTAQRKKKRRR